MAHLALKTGRPGAFGDPEAATSATRQVSRNH